MGIFDAFLGDDTFRQTFTGKAAPLESLRGTFESRLSRVLDDPRSAEEFKARSQNIRDQAAVLKRDSDTQADEELAGNLDQGALSKIKAKRRLDVDKQAAAGEREALDKTIVQGSSSFLQFLDVLARFQNNQEATEAGSVQAVHQAGLFDFAEGLGGAASSVGGGAFSLATI